MDELKNKAAKAVEEDYNCINFERVASSLIEEPEVCEWCEYYKNGYCYK